MNSTATRKPSGKEEISSRIHPGSALEGERDVNCFEQAYDQDYLVGFGVSAFR
jgi:hypothetical protein